MTITTILPETQWLRVVSHTIVQSPLGPLFLGATDSGICALDFIDSTEDLEHFERELSRRFGRVEMREDADKLVDLSRELDEYFAGSRREFDVEVDFGTVPGFSQRVWERLREIPYGKTTSYSVVATAVANPEASRAVGMAAGANPVAIVVPCHRVIGKDGSLVGYGGGLERKRWLLVHEKAIPPNAGTGDPNLFSWL